MMIFPSNFGSIPIDLHFIPIVFLLICLLPFSSNNKLRYYGCFVVYVLITSLVAVLLIPIFIFRPLNVKNARLAAYFLRHISKLVGIKWDLRNGNVLEVDQGAVIVSNHQSMFDILGLFSIWHVMDKCAAIARKEIFYVWPFGLSAWLGGVVFIDRLNGRVANQQLFDISKSVFENKTKMWIFAEGTRNRKRDTLLPFKRGGFRVAIVCQVPILPVVFSPYYFVDDEKKVFGRGPVTITCLDPISTKGLTENDIDSLMDKVRNLMIEQYEISKKEVLGDAQNDKKVD